MGIPINFSLLIKYLISKDQMGGSKIQRHVQSLYSV